MTRKQRDSFLLRIFRLVKDADQKGYNLHYDLYSLGESLVTEYLDMGTKSVEFEIASMEL